MVINKKNLSLVCVGSNIESLVCLHKFKENNIQLSGLITLDFQQQKRGSDYRDLVPFCDENDIETLFGIGGNNKSNSSSWILKKWNE